MTADKSRSLLRKFSIIFVGVALIPFIILFYLHSLYDESHSFIQILDTNFSLIIIIIGVVCLLGFFGIRLTIKKLALLTDTIKKSVIGKLEEKAILELAKEEGEIGELAGSFIKVLKRDDERKQQSKEIKEMVRDVLKKASEVLAVTNNYDNLIQLVLETAVEALGAKQGALFSVDAGLYTLQAWVGRNDVTLEEVMDAAQIYLDQMTRRNSFFLISTEEKSEQPDKLFTPPLLFSPLIHNEKSWGVLCFSGNSYWNKFSNEHKWVISSLSDQIAASIYETQINKNAYQASFEALAALAQAVEARDPYSRGHSIRVGNYAQKIGEVMGLPEEDIKILWDASMLHDIGKIGINYNILVKPGKISPEERSVIRNHPVVGESIALQLKDYKHLLDPIRHHHELLDGSGYPDGLQIGEISRTTRILTIADLFDTLMENRSYRTGKNLMSAKKEFHYLEKYRKIDKSVVSAFYSLIDEEGIETIYQPKLFRADRL
jgi:putative nucleotidyltransferase with HDIG domain